MQKICVVTGTRAEYGLLKPLLSCIRKQPELQLQLLVTAMHLSPEFGLTYKEIEKDGFNIDKKVEMLLSSDTPTSIIKSMGIGMIGFADALTELAPDLLIILGDRFEMLAVAQSALILKIPIAHLFGGEITEGAYDDSIRHAISKMSQIHFTSTDVYRKRVIQLGANPKLVFNTGALGLDNIKNLDLLSKTQIQNKLGIRFKKYNYLVTHHPVTLKKENTILEFEALLSVIKNQEDSFFIFTKSNADNGGREINSRLDAFVLENPGISVAFTSLGEFLYLSTMKYMTAVIGNSSSGIVEAPSLKVATINIGSRQKGRIQAQSIINCKPIEKDIKNAIKRVKSKEFKTVLDTTQNPYGSGNAASKILRHLQSIDFKSLIPSTFYDINF